MGQFSRYFLDDTAAILKQLDIESVEATAAVLRATRDRGGRLFFCGSGGGAGHASHATCDFRKLAGFEAYCVTDNVSELTARVNDEGWDTAYADWLRASRFGPKDCLFVFSVGGGSISPAVSVNLVKAMELATEVGASLVGVAGRGGGALRELATACIVLDSVDPALVTPQTEGLQALMWHLLVSHPQLAAATAKWEGLTGASSAVAS
jgi:D-sedoheptulose 7-phosphate isomerase